jgi:O-antigen ligase
MWLFIHRPFEVWPWLGALRTERVYMLIMLVYWLATGPKLNRPNRQYLAILTFTSVVLVSWILSPFRDAGQATVEDYLKTLVFYLLVVTSIRDGASLRQMIRGFLLSMTLYMAHSLWEYMNGRHHFRMGTYRMMAVDLTYGDPNAFAATICYALPFAAIWILNSRDAVERRCLAAYLGLSVICILLTGSRSGLVGIVALLGMIVRLSRKRLAILIGLIILAPVVWGMLPADRQKRFLTIIDPSYGPHNAQSSAESRLLGFWDGVRIWQDYPILGVGPGAHPHASYHGRPLHNLYGQLLADLGTGGLLAFCYLLACFRRNQREMREIEARGAKTVPECQFACHVVQSVGMSVLMLLLLGMAGHNLFRYQWIWFAGFQAAALNLLMDLSSRGGRLETFETSSWQGRNDEWGLSGSLSVRCLG